MSRKIEIGDRVEIAVTNEALDVYEGDTGYVIDIDLNEAYPYEVYIDDVGPLWVSDNEIALLETPVIIEPIIATNPVAAALAEQVGGTFRSPVQVPPVLNPLVVEDDIEIYCPYCGHNFHIKLEVIAS